MRMTDPIWFQPDEPDTNLNSYSFAAIPVPALRSTSLTEEILNGL